MLTVEALTDFGANTEEGLKRCFGNKDFYLKLVARVPNEASFDQLSEAIEQNNLEEAFEKAHALKGVLGNLSLTPIFTPTSELTELLREKKEGDYAGLTAEILKQRDLLKGIMES
ncbi:MAG: Hpt domain-containing protein [Lachnospiraceae bacterium]|nr:Hpt domain-containing protein [Lachnospiraceae bacterium]